MSIEERDNEELGSLPEDLRRERGTLTREEGAAVPPGTGLPPDIQRQEGVQAIPTLENRLMSQGANVRSVYDSRPINARDFIETQFTTISVPFSDPGIIVTNFNYFIPGGYVGVLRGFHYEVETPIGTADRSTFRCSILVNDIIDLGYENLFLGQVTPKYEPCFILVPLGGKLTFRFILTGDDVADAGVSDLPVYVELYGNLLLSQGVPLPFEIANLERIRPLGEP